MALALSFLGILFGAILIFILAEVALKKTIDIADHYGWSGTFIGLTILSIGTSLPEILTHVVASIDIVHNSSSLNTLSSLVVGTNIGSDIFQQNFVLPLVALIGTITVYKRDLNKEMGGLLFAALLLWVLSFGGLITRVEGALLVLAYIAYLIFIKNGTTLPNLPFSNGRRTKGQKKNPSVLESKKSQILAKYHLTKGQLRSAIFVILVAFALISVTTELLLKLSEHIIANSNISASFFGIIVLGIASALPELSTSVAAIIKGKKDISAGVLIGSNITNPLFALGLGAMISTYTVPQVVIIYDLPIKIATAVLLYYFLYTHEELQKDEATLMMILFFVYLILRQDLFPADLLGV